MIRNAVFDAGRNFCINGAADQALMLEIPKGLGQYLMRNVRHQSSKLIEPALVGIEPIETDQIPLSADRVQRCG